MTEQTNRRPFLSTNTHDGLKWLAQIVLPALGTLYSTLSSIWGLPFMGQVVGTIMAVDFFLGATLKLNSDRYYNSDERFSGEVNLDEENETSSMRLDPVDLHTKDEVTLKVKRARKHS